VPDHSAQACKDGMGSWQQCVHMQQTMPERLVKAKSDSFFFH